MVANVYLHADIGIVFFMHINVYRQFYAITIKILKSLKFDDMEGHTWYFNQNFYQSFISITRTQNSHLFLAPTHPHCTRFMSSCTLAVLSRCAQVLQNCHFFPNHFGYIFFSNLDGTYNPEIEICCADQVHDKKSMCCGNKVYNKDGKTSEYSWLYFLVYIIYILNIYLLYVSILTGHILSINQDMMYRPSA